MRGLFTISYGLLWGLIVLETLLLRQILRKTIRFKQIYADVFGTEQDQQFTKLNPGTQITDFRVRTAGSNTDLTMSDFLGHECIFLFVSPKAGPSYRNLSAAVYGMSEKVEGNLFLVCKGDAAKCRQLMRDNGLSENQFPLLLDSDGKIARRFLIDSDPEAVILDEEFRVVRYGHPVPPQHNGDTEHDHQAGPSLPPPNRTPAIEVPRLQHRTNGEGCDWPDDRIMSGAGFARMETTVSCVMTRFQLRSVWSLIPFYFAFRRVRHSARSVSGLLKAVFLIEDWRTCYTLSIWRNDCAIVEFGSIHAHVAAANSAFGPTWRKDLQRAEIWSAQFRLWAVSAHNLAWEGLDLQTELADQWAKVREVAFHG
jgi:peroxiredoxin